MIRNQIDPARSMFQWLMVLFDLWLYIMLALPFRPY
jgi:hypothetical protein